MSKPNPYRQQPAENTTAGASAAKVYTASPTLTRLHESRKVVKYVEGPVNSGKSTGCILEVIMRALRQAPGADNVRRSRWAIVRNSYPELKSTTIKSWEMWVPPHVAPVVYSSPIQCNFKQNLADGTRMELEVIFLAMDHPDDAARVLSMELTGVYINEGKEIGWELFEAIKGRTDRYPQFEILDDGTHVGGASEPGMVVDSNPPHISHWLYEKFETGAVPDGWEKFQQPPAVYWDEVTQDWVLNPDRENQRFTKPDYYTNQLKGAEETYVRVMLAGEYGASRRGKPVFSLYSEAKHVAKAKLDPDRQWPLIVGLDFGLNPGCVIGQLTRRGIRITDEVPTSDESLEDFLETYLVPLLAKRYAGYPVTIAGDPAGRGRSANDKRTSFDILGQFGLKGFPAYTNNFQVRKETVDHYLRRDEGLIISPHCTHLREAMATGYVWKESRNSKGASLDIADKNEFSHVCFVAGTLIDTPSGQRPIESLGVGDEVCGPFGPQKVEAVGTKYAPETIALDVGGCSTIHCTPEHPFAVAGEWVRASALLPGCALEYRAWQTSKNSWVCGSTGYTTDEAITSRLEKRRAWSVGTYIGAFGRQLTGLFHRGMLFIIGTMIQATTTWIIYSACRTAIIDGCMQLSLLMPSGSGASRSWPKFARSQRHGTPAQRGASGTGNTEKMPGWIGRLRMWYARSAEKLMRVKSVQSSEDFARLHARTRLVGDREWMTRQEFALAVDRALCTTGTAREGRASLVLRRTSVRGGQIVHALKVSGTGTYYAQGLHVSNCDSLQYLALWAKYGYRPQPVREHGPKKKTMMV